MTPETPGTPPELAPAEAFRLWSPTYDRETGLSVLEDRAARALTPPLQGLRLLDVGCGTGRRLDDALTGGAALAVGVDLVPEMVRHGLDRGIEETGQTTRGGPRGPGHAGPGVSSTAGRRAFAVADSRALPVCDQAFDVVWCRLMLGFLPDPAPVFRELARAARPGAPVLMTDLHPACPGARRTFTDSSGRVRSVEHHLHAEADQLRAADEAGLRLEQRLEAEVGPEIRRFYEEAGALHRYERDRGMAAVLALLFVRDHG